MAGRTLSKRCLRVHTHRFTCTQRQYTFATPFEELGLNPIQLSSRCPATMQPQGKVKMFPFFEEASVTTAPITGCSVHPIGMAALALENP